MNFEKEIEDLSISVINDFPQHSGIGEYSHSMHSNIINHGFNSTFYQFYVNSNELFEADKVNDSVKQCNGINFRTKYSLEVNKLMGRNWRSFKEVNSDIVHLSNPSLAPLARYLKKSIVTIHDLYYLFYSGNSKLMSHFYRTSYKKLRKSSNYIAVSEFTRSQSIEHLGLEEDNISVIYPSIDTSFFKRDCDQNEKPDKKNITLLHVGYDSPNKNISTLFNVISLLPEEFNLVRVGKTTARNYKLMHDLGIDKRVMSYDHLSKEELRLHYREADIFIFPSLYEGFGIPVIEAMSCGLPTLVTDQKPMPEIVKNAALITGKTPEEIVEGIFKLTEKQFKTKFSSAGEKNASRFSMNSQFLALRKLYNKLY